MTRRGAPPEREAAPDPYQAGFAPRVIGTVARADFGVQDVAEVIVEHPAWPGDSRIQIVRLRDGRWGAIGVGTWVASDLELLLAALARARSAPEWAACRALPGCPDSAREWLEAVQGIRALAK